ncbi:MAG: LexA family transcriptional regulator, partial [Bacteroidota bacterium]|nr:LexA family transcriptional regulator [Bacteroidota bacterium]
MYFGKNIKLLRQRLKITQSEVAEDLKMKRSTLSGYENSVSHPTIKAMLAFSKYYTVSIDTLLKMDLSELTDGILSEVIDGSDVFINGTKLRVLATTVNSENIENIELIHEKAKAGYTTGFADPEFIKLLPTFHLPFLSKERKYRTFQISGDSMLPIPDGAYVTGEYVENWRLIRDRHAYIILTMDDGIVFKVTENKIEKEKKLTLYSLNPIYEPYNIHIKEVKEVWKFVNYISTEVPEGNLPKDELLKTVSNLKKDMDELK